MKKACLVVHPVYQKNEIFKPDSRLNRDNCLAFFHELKTAFAAKGYDLQTNDMISTESADVVIYNEMPKNTSAVDKNKSAVLLFESELIRPDNWDLNNHKKFKYIFTWNDAFVDHKKYIKFNFTDSSPIKSKTFKEKQKLCVLVSGNKYVSHPKELYSKRIEAIRWFEKNHPNDLDLYGIGWDLYIFKIPLFSRVLNRFTRLRKILGTRWALYKGSVDSKAELMQNYKFSICYENAEGISGYITEKIFDSMSAGCVPVYWGAPNIKHYIPEQCFIDKTQFKSYEDLYQYLTSMTEAEYSQRQLAISEYLKSEQHRLFEPAYNATVIAEELVNQ